MKKQDISGLPVLTLAVSYHSLEMGPNTNGSGDSRRLKDG